MHPRNMVCFRYIIVYTLHKDDNKYNNNNNNKIWNLNGRDRCSGLNRRSSQKKMRVTRDMMTMTTTRRMINPWDGFLVAKVIATWIAWRRKFLSSSFFCSDILCCSHTLAQSKTDNIFTPIQNTSSAIHLAQRIRLVRSWVDSPTASTTICRLSTSVYSVQLQLPTISGHRQPSGATFHPRQREDITASYRNKNPTETPISPTSPFSIIYQFRTK